MDSLPAGNQEIENADALNSVKVVRPK